jgi:hypothetical protein
MNDAQRKISWAVYFAIGLAILHELIYDNEHHSKFDWFSVIAETIAVLLIGSIAYHFSKNRKN